MTEPQSQAAAPECYRHPGRETYIRCQRCDRPICPDCMRSAAVGFQCPTCVAEGTKATRSGRTAYGGQRSGNPARTSQVLIGINLAVWLGILATGWGSSDWIGRLVLIPRGFCAGPGVPDSESLCAAVGGTWFPGVADGSVWQLVTSMFSHVEPIHIGFNMLALWALGPQLELALGRARFLALYFLSGLGGSALVYLASAPDSRTLGASGAIFGLMAALLVIAIKVRGNVQQILFWIGINFFITFALHSYISWQGHLGGFLTGLALMAILVWAPRPRRTTWQAAGFAAIGVLIAVAIVLRTVSLS